MKQELTKGFVDGAAALAGSTGVLTVTLSFFDKHAAGIGGICTVVFGLIYIVFQFLAAKKLTIADENKADLKVLEEVMVEHIKDTEKSFKDTEESFAKVDHGIGEIKTMLSRRQTDVIRHDDKS